MAGAEKMLYEVATRLDKEKFEPFVCTLKNEKNGLLLSKLREKNISTYFLSINSKLQFFRIFKFYFVIKQQKPDILQSFLFFDNIVARILGKLAGVPIIISGQRSVEVERSFLRNFLDRITIRLADAVVSNTEAGKDILVEREKVSPQKIKVIPNGITPNLYMKRNIGLEKLKKDGQDTKVIGFIGGLTRQKGVNYLLEAAKFIKTQGKNFSVVVIGDGPEKQNLENYTGKLDIKNIVRFWGYKEDAAKYIKLFDVLVLPSIREGMPNVILEAMVCGVPVVATKVGGVPEIVEDGKSGFFVEPRNPKDLAEKILKILDMSEGERREMGEHGRKIVKEKFSIEKMVKEYENLYQELLEKNK